MAIFNNIYNVDFEKLVLEELPTFKRRIRLYSFIMCLIKPFRLLYSEFIAYRRKTVYKIEHTGQVGFMENVLNDAYDIIDRRIYIEDGIYKDPTYLFKRVENKPEIVYKRSENQTPIYLFRRDDLKLFDVDFVVVLPLDLLLSIQDEIRFKALIDYYRLPDKTYTIRYE